jgi:TRAP-type uncharacterized transport system substrate-binding protein
MWNLVRIPFLLALMALPVHAVEPDWPDAITIATGSPGGTYFVYGEGLVARFSQIVGYRCLSLIRASIVVNRQSALAW